MCNPTQPGSSNDSRPRPATSVGRNAYIDDDLLAERAGQYMLAMPQSIAWFTGGVYDGHSLSRKAGSWLLVVRMTLNRHPVVSFTEGDTVGQVFREFAIGIAFDLTVWRADQYR